MTVLTIGAEIEWSCSPKSGEQYSPVWKTKYDATIRGKYQAIEFITSLNHLWKIDTKNPNPGIEKACADFKKLVDSMNKIDVNTSQGLHFHVSGFKKKHVLYSKEFYDELINEYKAKATTKLEKARIDTRYARFRYDQQERYRAINYVGAWRKQNTFEFRFFPSTKKVSEFRKYLKMLVKHIRRVENYKVKLDRIDGMDEEQSAKDEINFEDILF